MQLNEASLMLSEAASYSAPWLQSPHRPTIDSGSRPLQSPNQVLWFNFSGLLWLGVASGQCLLVATETVSLPTQGRTK